MRKKKKRKIINFMERLIAGGHFWQAMNIAIGTGGKKVQDLGFLRFLAQPPGSHDSKGWPATRHNHIELGFVEMLWNMHWKERAGL